MPTAKQWHDALLEAGAENALEGSRLAEFAEKYKPPSAA
jgi:hypothetical protein